MSEQLAEGIVATKSTLLSLIRSGQLMWLPGLDTLDVVVPDQVRDEVQATDRDTLDEACRVRIIHWEPLYGVGPITLYSRLLDIMGPGDAAAVALAHARRWVLSADDGSHFAREAARVLGAGRVINAAGLLFLIGRGQARRKGA